MASDMAYWHWTLDNTKVQKKSQTSARPPPSLHLVTGSRSATPFIRKTTHYLILLNCT